MAEPDVLDFVKMSVAWLGNCLSYHIVNEFLSWVSQPNHCLVRPPSPLGSSTSCPKFQTIYKLISLSPTACHNSYMSLIIYRRNSKHRGERCDAFANAPSLDEVAQCDGTGVDEREKEAWQKELTRMEYVSVTCTHAMLTHRACVCALRLLEIVACRWLLWINCFAKPIVNIPGDMHWS